MLVEEKAADYIKEENEPEIENSEVTKEGSSNKTNKIFNILKTKTGEGSIKSYDEHPLNFNNNKYISQILRGLTGILGALDLAIIDISMGILGLFKDKNKPVEMEIDQDV